MTVKRAMIAVVAAAAVGCAVLKYMRSPSKGERDGRSKTVEGFTYDVAGKVSAYTSGAMSFAGAFDLAGQALTRDYRVGGASAFTWDTSDRDGSGNILSAADTMAGKDLSLTYDGQDRLASAQGTILRGYQNCSYLYDAAGNRSTESCYGHPVTYDYETTAQSAPTNRLGAISWLADDLSSCGGPQTLMTRDYDVDVLGRATNGYLRKFPIDLDAFTMTYGPSGRVASVTTPGGAYNYTYDHHNLRVAKDGPGVAVRFGYDQNGRLQVEQDNTGATKEYVYLGGEPLAMLVDEDVDPLTPSTTYLLGTDHLGTPMRAWDAAGSVAWAADYEAFGKAWEYLPGTTATPSIDVPLRFPGQYEDQETGLHYNWWRYYDPNTGRYVTADPVGPQRGAQEQPVYTYALGNSLQYKDQNGALVGVDDALALSAALTLYFLKSVYDLCQSSARQWSCTASCNLEGVGPQCGGRVSGSSSGSSEGDACRAAKRSATQSAPLGCYARHCQCQCSK